jgi:hypothetical protein
MWRIQLMGDFLHFWSKRNENSLEQQVQQVLQDRQHCFMIATSLERVWKLNIEVLVSYVLRFFFC